MGTLVLNFKSHQEVLGDGAVKLARIAESVSHMTNTDIILAPPAPFLALVASKTSCKVYAQSIDQKPSSRVGRNITAQMAAAAGARGAMLNHSDFRIHARLIESAALEVRNAGLELLLCSETTQEAGRLAKARPTYLVIEDKQLIGSGVSITSANPNLISDSLKAARAAGFKGRFLSGAGIREAKDVETAISLGADGVLVSSAVIKSADWRAKLLELSRPLGG